MSESQKTDKTNDALMQSICIRTVSIRAVLTLDVRSGIKSPNQETGPGNRGRLKAPNETK